MINFQEGNRLLFLIDKEFKIAPDTRSSMKLDSILKYGNTEVQKVREAVKEKALLNLVALSPFKVFNKKKTSDKIQFLLMRQKN